MAVTKLRADAPPFLPVSRCRLQFPPPPPPHRRAPCHYHPAVCPPPSPFVPNYPFVPLPLLVPPPGPIYGSHPPPPPHPAAVPVPPFLGALPPRPRRKGPYRFLARLLRPLPAAKGHFLRKAGASPRSTTPSVHLSSKDVPAPPPPTSRAPLGSKDVPSPPPPTSRAPLRPMVTLPHGAAPHKHLFGPPRLFIVGEDLDGEKLRAQAAAEAAAMAQAAEPVKPGKETPPFAAASRPGKRTAPPRLLRRQQEAAGTGRGKVVGPRQAKAPVERARKPAARSPSPTFTTRRTSPMPAPEWRKRPVTTVMIRNVPNRLKPCEMLQLLDEHCARANSKTKKKNPVLAAYDFLYLPMDFSKSSSNMGYAFVNLTTAEAARGLHYALHGARWKVHGTKKVIDIRSARIQGKEALMRHFSGSTFPCHTDEYLPAAFSPPRDGTAGTTSALGRHVGNRVHTPAPAPLPQPLPVAVAPAPKQQQQQLAWRPVEAKLQAHTSSS